MSEEPSIYPEYTPLREMPITASIPYLYRWKILNLKLMLNDLQYLADKHGIYSAGIMIDLVCKEAEEMIAAITTDINEKRAWREKLAEN